MGLFDITDEKLQVKLAEAIAKKKGTDRIEVAIERNMRLIQRLGRILPERGECEGSLAETVNVAADVVLGVDGTKFREVRFVGSFAPDFEFEEAREEDVRRIFADAQG